MVSFGAADGELGVVVSIGVTVGEPGVDAVETNVVSVGAADGEPGVVVSAGELGVLVSVGTAYGELGVDAIGTDVVSVGTAFGEPGVNAVGTDVVSVGAADGEPGVDAVEIDKMSVGAADGEPGVDSVGTDALGSPSGSVEVRDPYIDEIGCAASGDVGFTAVFGDADEVVSGEVPVSRLPNPAWQPAPQCCALLPHHPLALHFVRHQ